MEFKDYAEQLRDRRAREEAISKWRYRFKALAKRGISMAHICREEGFDQSELCHKMKLDGKRIGEWALINRVTEALDKYYGKAGLQIKGKR